MRVLLDENMDQRLKRAFDSDFAVMTVTEGAFPFCWFFCQGTVGSSGWTRVTPPARAWRNAGPLQEAAWII